MSEEYEGSIQEEQNDEQVVEMADSEQPEGVEEQSSARNDVIDISDEQLDEIADTAIAVLRDVLKYFNVGEVTIDEYEGDEGC